MDADVSTPKKTFNLQVHLLNLAETMLWGAVVMCLALLVGGILDMYAQEGGPNQRKYGAGVAAMTFFYTATFGATWLTTPWLYPTEVSISTLALMSIGLTLI